LAETTSGVNNRTSPPSIYTPREPRFASKFNSAFLFSVYFFLLFVFLLIFVINFPIVSHSHRSNAVRESIIPASRSSRRSCIQHSLPRAPNLRQHHSLRGPDLTSNSNIRLRLHKFPLPTRFHKRRKCVSSPFILPPLLLTTIDLKFSDLVLIPNVVPSLFDDKVNAQPLEVTISDASIFRPGAAEPQSAVRRAELMPASSNGLTVGVKTLHFSLQPDATRPLNVSHEYLLVFLETADFSANQFRIKTGTLLGSNGADRDNLLVLGNSKAGNQVLFSTPFVDGVFTNLALKLDFDEKLVSLLY